MNTIAKILIILIIFNKAKLLIFLFFFKLKFYYLLSYFALKYLYNRYLISLFWFAHFTVFTTLMRTLVFINFNSYKFFLVSLNKYNKYDIK